MVYQIFTAFDWTWAVTVVIAIVTFTFVNQWVRRKSLPPGPTPLPIIGNILDFVGGTRLDTNIARWRKKYGDFFTLWMGPDPMIVVCGYENAKEGLLTMKNTFSGRPSRFSSELFLDGGQDVFASDYSPLWETLRKVIHMAARKYAVSDKLPLLIDDVVKQVTPLMVAEKGAVDPGNFIYLTVYNVLASSAFGKRYDMNEYEFLSLKKANDVLMDEIGFGNILDLYPSLRFILRGTVKKHKRAMHTFRILMENQYVRHKKSYVKGMVRDFTDALINAKEDAEADDKGTAGFFTDKNMILLLLDLFTAGTETTRQTLSWILLYLSQYPEVQDKVRKEVLENIGDRMPEQVDRHKCPYTTAVITETLRIRPIVSTNLEHSATSDTEFGGYKIPKGTSITFHIQSQHMDAKYWDEPETYRPERFLEEDGTFMTITKFTGYMPFGMGRRACPGEKLALADIFLLLVGFVRKCRFSLPDGAGSADLEPQNIIIANVPKPYELKIEAL